MPDGLDPARHAVEVGHVEERDRRGAAVGDDLVGDRLRPRLDQVVDHDVGPDASERAGDALAEVLAGAGHQRPASGKVEERVHHASRSQVVSVTVARG